MEEADQILIKIQNNFRRANFGTREKNCQAVTCNNAPATLWH